MKPIWTKVVLAGLTVLPPGGVITFGMLVGIPEADTVVDPDEADGCTKICDG